MLYFTKKHTVDLWQIKQEYWLLRLHDKYKYIMWGKLVVVYIQTEDVCANRYVM